METETVKSCNDSKMLQIIVKRCKVTRDYVEQKSHGRKNTHL